MIDRWENVVTPEIDQQPPGGPGIGHAGIELDPAAEADFAALVARRRADDEQHRADTRARRILWLTHHWPEQYGQRCVRVGPWPVCRRCSALYGVGFLVALAMTFGRAPWSDRWDPGLIWLLCLPGTVAFVGEALGWLRYSVRWQVATTMVAGLAFGKALGYELDERWSSEFWGPIAVFGGIWFFAGLIGHRRKAHSLPSPGAL